MGATIADFIGEVVRKVNRESNYDLLRIFSAIAVVAIHVNAMYLQTNIETYAGGGLSATWIIENFINFITRFLVPCFVMLSGAFVLHDTRNGDTKFFYKKAFWKIVLPFVLIYGIWICYGARAILKDDISSYILTLFTGTYGNLWFMPMLIGLYILSPLVIKLKKGKPIPLSIGILLLVWAAISQGTSDYTLPYSVGTVFAYLAYFIMGNILYEMKTRWHPAVCVLGIVVISSVATWWRCMNHQFYAFEYYRAFFSPLVILLSIFIFILFKGMRLDGEKKVEWLAKKTYYIYLLHTPVMVIAMKLINRIEINELLKILGGTVITFVLSIIMAIIYGKLINMILLRVNIKGVSI